MMEYQSANPEQEATLGTANLVAEIINKNTFPFYDRSSNCHVFCKVLYYRDIDYGPLFISIFVHLIFYPYQLMNTQSKFLSVRMDKRICSTRAMAVDKMKIDSKLSHLFIANLPTIGSSRILSSTG